MVSKPRIVWEPVKFGTEIYVPINVEAIRVDTNPPFDLYFRPGKGQPFVLYCDKNVKFTPEVRRRISMHRIEQLYIKQRSRGDYNRYLAENIQQILSDKRVSAKEKSSILYDSAQAVVEEVFSAPTSRENLRRGKDIAGHTVSYMGEKDFQLEHLLRTMSSDYYLYTHSVNVATYAVALAMRAGVTETPLLRELANGALLHDVGKVRIDPRILKKEEGLSAEEWTKMQEVPRLGYEMMRDADCLGELALDIILNHQEKLTGEGYPNKLAPEKISQFVRIVTIVDTFDALTSDRHHQKKCSSFEALHIMQRDMRAEIDGELFKLFVNMMGNP